MGESAQATKVAEGAGTPTDPDPVVQGPRKKRKAHGGEKKRLLGQGEGDFCIYEIAPQGGSLPGGCLVPIPEVPRFESTVEAQRWIRNQSGDLLAGKQVMIFRATGILKIRSELRPQVLIESKQRVAAVSKPKGESGASGSGS